MTIDEAKKRIMFEIQVDILKITEGLISDNTWLVLDFNNFYELHLLIQFFTNLDYSIESLRMNLIGSLKDMKNYSFFVNLDTKNIRIMTNLKSHNVNPFPEYLKDIEDLL